MIVEYGLRISQDTRHPYLVAEKNYTYDCNRLDDPEKINQMFRDCFFLHIRAEEHVYAVMLDQSMHPLGVFETGHGTATVCYL